MCRRYHRPRYLVPRALLTAPKVVPDWYCAAIGVQYERAYPEYVFDVSPDQWIELVQDAALVTVKGQLGSPSAIGMQLLRSNELKTEKDTTE